MLKPILAIASNALALFAIDWLAPGVEVTDNPIGFVILLALFTAANSIILPMARFIFKPLSILTFGLVGVILNGILIYFVDILSEGITINGVLSLLMATVIVGAVNGTIAYGAKVFTK